MADIVDTMFGWIVDIFAWIIDKTIMLIGWIIKVLFKGIVSLFRRDEGVETPKEPSSTTEEQPKMRSYEGLADDINGITEINQEDYSKDKMMNIVMTVLLHNSLSYAQKARLIVQSDKKIKDLINNPASRGHFYASLIDLSYALLNQMSNGALTGQWDKFKAALDSNSDVELEPLGNYLISIMNIVSALYSPDGKSSFNVSMLEGVELPKWAGSII